MLISCNKVPNKKSSALRKKISDFAFALYDSVPAINAQDWDVVASYGSPFLKTSYLSALENQRPENMFFHYAIIYDGKTPVAIAYFQVVDFSSETFEGFIDKENTDFSCPITAYLKKYLTDRLIRTADKMNVRLLICGNAFVSGEHGFACSPEIDKTEVFDALADIIYEISRVEKTRGKISAILVKDFYTSTKQASDELKEFKYHDFLVEPNMIVTINWKTFDEYLNAMSKKYRNRAKSIVKKGLELQRKNFSANDIKENSEQIQRLYNNVHLKASFRMASLSTDYFVEMKKVLQDKFNFVAYYHNGELVGFKSSFILEESIEAHFIGLNYEVNKELELYQNMLYDYVKETIDSNFKELILGRTASEIKSTVGAEAYQLTCYIRHRNPLSNHLIKPFIDSIKTTDWIPRNPFKEIAIQDIQST
jgi:hypothetical protein